ncbi:hypothetical protein N0V82_002917 [Gnomoniopsis sp. IMI 355080]|nr:hypothetical protein N0V82_002917 [Gnomoniopsis sp. IMI 355080]
MVRDHKENHDPHAIYPSQPTQSTPKTANFAIAFDIDGVLVRGKEAIAGAKAALEHLDDNRIPFILLTNGGGHTEATHSKMVGCRLGLHIDEDQFVQSHTPFKSFREQYQEQWVLCLGGEKTKIKELARAYGFSPDTILSSSDLIKQTPQIHPFSEMTMPHHKEHGIIQKSFTPDQKISAIFVFSSPRDWCLDIQICVDLLLSEGGRLATRSNLNGDETLPNYGYQQDDQPPIYFCNPDLEWATSYPQARLAQGGFRAALEGVWSKYTDGKAPLQAWTCGKPTETTYVYAENAIENHRRKLGNEAHIPDLRTIYMVGDNPMSDICGANMANETSYVTWRSVLVETGVYNAGTVPGYQPTAIKRDVWEAVHWIIQQETGKGNDGESC